MNRTYRATFLGILVLLQARGAHAGGIGRRLALMLRRDERIRRRNGISFAKSKTSLQVSLCTVRSPVGPLVQTYDRYTGFWRFLSDHGARMQWALSNGRASVEIKARDLTTDLVEMVLFVAIKQLMPEQCVMFHGACFVTRGHAVLILGPGGAGKTTLLLQEIRRGGLYLADDYVIIVFKKQAQCIQGVCVGARTDPGRRVGRNRWRRLNIQRTAGRPVYARNAKVSEIVVLRRRTMDAAPISHQLMFPVVAEHCRTFWPDPFCLNPARAKDSVVRHQKDTVLKWVNSLNQLGAIRLQ